MRRKRNNTTNKSNVSTMAQILFPGTEGGYVMKWLVAEGQGVDAKQLLGRCFLEGQTYVRRPTVDILAPYDGTITSLSVKVNEKIPVGESPMIARMKYCLHDQVFNGLCCVCGRAPSQKGDSGTVNSSNDTGVEQDVDPSHANAATITVNLPGGDKLMVSNNQAQDDRKITVTRLLKSKKLLLVLDLDNTLLHATFDSRAPAFTEAKGLTSALHTFKLPGLEGNGDPDQSHYLMLRPGLEDWLPRMAAMYELYIYTNGTRAYAEIIASIIDPSKKYFGDRIVSRTDVPELKGGKRLSRLFPVDTNMVLALDDRADVWQHDPYNLITIKPYRFFKRMQEMNQAPELEFESPLGDGEDIPPHKGPTSSHEVDIHLKRAGDLLQWIHEKFFENTDLTVEEQLEQKGRLRAKILRGITMTVNMRSEDENASIIKLATACGAKCERQLTKSTNLLLSNHPESPMTVQAKLDLIWVLRPEWLYACIHNWHREPQAPYSLFVLSGTQNTKQKNSTKPVTVVSGKSGISLPVDEPFGPPLPKVKQKQNDTETNKRKMEDQKFDEFGYPVSDDEDTNPPKREKALNDDNDNEDSDDEIRELEKQLLD